MPTYKILFNTGLTYLKVNINIYSSVSYHEVEVTFSNKILYIILRKLQKGKGEEPSKDRPDIKLAVQTQKGQRL